MTNNNVNRMTKASSPEDNVRRLFELYGPQIAGAGDDAEVFLNGIQGLDAQGHKAPGWRKYNSVDANWVPKTRDSIREMQRDLPLYLPARSQGRRPG